MERAARLLARMSQKSVPSEELVCAAWPHAAGKKVAPRTRATGMVRSTLVVEVEDVIWQKQLTAVRGQLLKNLTRLLGAGLVDGIEFRIGVPRIGPQRETEVQPFALAADEADMIRDPILRRLYRQDRRRAQRTLAAGH